VDFNNTLDLRSLSLTRQITSLPQRLIGQCPLQKKLCLFWELYATKI